MKTQKRKIEGKFLCVLMAIAVLMSLIVLPLAKTINQNASVNDSRYSDSDAADAGGSECVTDSQAAGKADFIYKNDDITVKAVFSDLTEIPDNTELQVTPITEGKDSGKYSEVKAQVNENVKADNQTVTGFLAYDIYFMVNGTKYEPENGTVTVTIQYNHPLFDEKIKKATDEIKVLHLKETGTETKVEDVTKTVDVADVGKDAAMQSKTEVTSEAGSKTSGNDTVQFVTNSFSPYAVIGVAASSTTATTSGDIIATGLGRASNFAVFARQYTLNGDMEGNIAVDSFTMNGGNVGNSGNVYSTTQSTFSLNISVSGVANKTYQVGIYTDATGKNIFKKVPVNVDVSGKGTATVTDLNSTTVYYAYLLDDSGSPILGSTATTQGITGGGTVIYSGNDSYIQTINKHDNVFKSASVGSTTIPQSVTFGSSYTLSGGNASSDGKTGTGNSNLMSGSTTWIQGIGGGTSNIASIGGTEIFKAIFDTFSSLSSLSLKLSSAGSCDSTTMKVINVSPLSGENDALKSALKDALGYSDQNDVANKGIPLNSNQYLLVNVNCGSNTSITIPACPIGGINYGTAWADIASRIIWNFYSGSSVYTGTVFTKSSMLGTILAPSATVDYGSTMCGAIYANKIINTTGEIHKLTFRSTTSVTRDVSFTVPSSNTTSLTVKKVWAGDCNYSANRPKQITIRLLQNSKPFQYQGHDSVSFTGTGDNWTYTFTGLALNDSQGKPYTYTVVEDAVPYYTATYSTPTSTSISTLCTCPDPCDDTITITNTYTPAIVLPETGGIGTNLFYGAGVGIILFSAVLMIIYQIHRKRKTREKKTIPANSNPFI